MKWVVRLFLLALKLYPRPFRARFTGEMEDVFRSGLELAREQGVVAGFLLREMLHLPASLVGMYIWSMRAQEGGQMAVSRASGGGTIGMTMPGEGWGASLLAGLPHLITGIFIVSSTIIGSMKGINQNVFGYLQIIVYTLLLVGGVMYCIYKGWKRWSASWIAYMFIFALILLSVGVNALPPSLIGNDALVNRIEMIAIPLILAYLLYKIACVDRLRGLLAAVPVMAIIWVYFQEFVTILLQSFAWTWFFLLAFAATVKIIRTKSFTTALGLTMVIPMLGGLPFVYLGVYKGGTLPFSEPGPSLQEVFRQYLPFMVMALAIALGPQLAIRLRAVGHESAKTGGKIFYRLALGGLLLGLFLVVLQLAGATDGIYISLAIRQVGIIVATVLYLAGFLLLVWSAMHSGALSGDNGGTVLKLAALFILLPCVPIVVFLAVPNVVTGSQPEGWLIFVAEIVWVLASIWVVKD